MRLGILLHVVGSILVELGRRLHPRHELLVLQSDELFSRVSANNAIGHELLALVVLGHFLTVGDVSLWRQIGVQPAFGQYDGHLLAVVGIVGLYGHIVNLRAYAEGRVRGQRPGRRRPGHEVKVSPTGISRTPGFSGQFTYRPEQRRHRGVLHVAVAAGLVQLVARQASACGG